MNDLMKAGRGREPSYKVTFEMKLLPSARIGRVNDRTIPSDLMG